MQIAPTVIRHLAAMPSASGMDYRIVRKTSTLQVLVMPARTRLSTILAPTLSGDPAGELPLVSSLSVYVSVSLILSRPLCRMLQSVV